MTQLIIARKALGPSLSPGGGLEALPGFRWSFSHPVPWDSGMWLSPIPPQLPCWPSKAGHRPSCSLAPVLGLFFWHFQPCRRREGCCLMQRAAGCSPGTRVRHHLDKDWRQLRLQNGIFPAWEDPWSSHGACTLSQLSWELPARLPVDNTPARRISWGFLLAVVSWRRPRGAHFGSGGDDNGGCFLARGFSRP